MTTTTHETWATLLAPDSLLVHQSEAFRSAIRRSDPDDFDTALGHMARDQTDDVVHVLQGLRLVVRMTTAPARGDLAGAQLLHGELLTTHEPIIPDLRRLHRLCYGLTVGWLDKHGRRDVAELLDAILEPPAATAILDRIALRRFGPLTTLRNKREHLYRWARAARIGMPYSSVPDRRRPQPYDRVPTQPHTG